MLGRNRVKKRIGCVPNLFLVGHNKQLRKNEFCPGGFAFKGLSISALRQKNELHRRGNSMKQKLLVMVQVTGPYFISF